MKAYIAFKQPFILETGIKALAMIFLFLTCAVCASAQTTSYSANAIPLNVNCTGCAAFGVSSLHSNATGSLNTATGVYSLYSNTIGSANTSCGYQSLAFNITGSNNTANGTYALYNNTTGNNNTAVGFFSLNYNTTGYQNSANGYTSLFNNTTGNNNAGNGAYSLKSNTTGSYNTANGYRTLFNNDNGNNNTALGDSAGYLSTGSKNVFLGNSAGFYETTGSDKLYLADDSNKTIMYGDFSTGQILLGNPTPTGYTFKGSRTLNVLGGIIADSMRVALRSYWADYVFADDYKLKPLQDLAEYIKTNKHLPGVPSSDEVAKNGIELGSMDAGLLEKIEELNLYILQQQNDITQQKKQNEVQNKSIELLQEQINEQNKFNKLLQQQMAELKRQAKN